MSNVSGTGFTPIQQYKAPTQTQNDKLFFQPAGTTVLGGASPQDYLTAGSPTPDMITNRTVKVDGAYTRDQMGQMGEALSGQIGTVNQNLGTGFAGTNANIKTGFDATNQNLGTINTNLTNGVGAINTNVGKVNDNVSAVGTAVGNTNTNVLAGNTANAAGFTKLNDLIGTQQTAIDKLGTNQTNYFTTLSHAQDAAKAQVGALQSGFTNFNDQYTKDTARQDQGLNSIQTGMQGNYQDLRQAIGDGAQAASTQANRIVQAVGGSSMGTPRTAQGGSMGFAGPAPQAGPQMAPQAPQDPFVGRLNTIRNILQTPGVDPRVAGELYQVATAFDQNGALIPSTPNQDGSRIARALGPDGTLFSAVIGVDGNAISSGSVNINNAMSLVDMMTGNRN